MWTSSNPVLTRGDKFKEAYGEMSGTQQAEVTTLQGVINKTAILTLIAVVAGSGGYAWFTTHSGTLLIGWITTFILTIGIYFVIYGNPRRAPYLAPVYAVIQGAFLGGFTAFAESMLASRGLTVVGGVALQAFIVTISVLLAMLGLYSSRIIQPVALS